MVANGIGEVQGPGHWGARGERGVRERRATLDPRSGAGGSDIYADSLTVGGLDHGRTFMKNTRDRPAYPWVPALS